MALTSTTQVVTSFPVKASQTQSGTNGSRLAASSGAVASIAPNSSSSLSANLSATANVSAASSASVTPSLVLQGNLPSPSSTSRQYSVASPSGSEIASASVTAKSTTSQTGINPTKVVDFSPRSADVKNLVKTAITSTRLSPTSVNESPQFSLKQGAISVQGLLGQSNTAPPSLSLVSPSPSGSGDDNAQSSGKTVEKDVEPSVADVFASIYGADEQETQEPEPDPQATEPQQAEVEDVREHQVTNQQQEKSDQRQQVIAEQEQASATQAAKIEAALIAQLSKRDAEVKSHEQAHASVGGSYAQSPSFRYEKGPDGRRYAVDGEVQIDVSVVNGDAQATLNKMMKVYAAAMAPVQPSMADIRVAADALQKMNAAREELAIERQQGVIKLDDADHIIGLGRKLQRTEQEESRSQLEPFEKKPDEPKTNAIASGKINATNATSSISNNNQTTATLAYTSDSSSTYEHSENNNNVSGFIHSQAQVDFYV